MGESGKLQKLRDTAVKTTWEIHGAGERIRLDEEEREMIRGTTSSISSPMQSALTAALSDPVINRANSQSQKSEQNTPDLAATLPLILSPGSAAFNRSV